MDKDLSEAFDNVASHTTVDQFPQIPSMDGYLIHLIGNCSYCYSFGSVNRLLWLRFKTVFFKDSS